MAFSMPMLPAHVTPLTCTIDCSDKSVTQPEDSVYATAFSYHLLCQIRVCKLDNQFRFGRHRKNLPLGFPGLACRHCYNNGQISGRWFSSTIKTMADSQKTLNLMGNHLIDKCPRCPEEVKTLLKRLRLSHDNERAHMNHGAQLALFSRIWDRMHGSAQAAWGSK